MLSTFGVTIVYNEKHRLSLNIRLSSHLGSFKIKLVCSLSNDFISESITVKIFTEVFRYKDTLHFY